MNHIENLIITSASRIHENWCMKELKSFFERTKNIDKRNQKSPLKIYEEACFKNGFVRDEIDFDWIALINDKDLLEEGLNNFDIFLSLYQRRYIEIKKFVVRKLDNDEIKRLNNNGEINYVDGCENILRPFNSLSLASKKRKYRIII